MRQKRARAADTAGISQQQQPSHIELEAVENDKTGTVEQFERLTLPRVADLAAAAAVTPTETLASGTASSHKQQLSSERPRLGNGKRSGGAACSGSSSKGDNRTTSSSCSSLDLSELSVLDASGRGIREVAELTVCKKLSRLNLSENKLTVLDCISMNIQLRWLKVAKNSISSGESLRLSLRNLLNLVVLDLSDNQITRMEDFAGLPNLKTLVLSHNQIQRLPFATCPLANLQCLILSHNQIEVVEKPTRPLDNLRKLSLGDNRLKTFPFSAQFPALTELRLNGNALLSVGSGVVCMSSLRILDVGKNQIHRIEGLLPLAGHLKLTQLNVLGNPLCGSASVESSKQEQQQQQLEQQKQQQQHVIELLQHQLLEKLPSLKILNTRLLHPLPVNARKQRWKMQRLQQQQQKQEQSAEQPPFHQPQQAADQHAQRRRIQNGQTRVLQQNQGGHRRPSLAEQHKLQSRMAQPPPSREISLQKPTDNKKLKGIPQDSSQPQEQAQRQLRQHCESQQHRYLKKPHFAQASSHTGKPAPSIAQQEKVKAGDNWNRAPRFKRKREKAK